MLTSVAAARSASDLSRDSAARTIAAPADSRLTTKNPGHGRICTTPAGSHTFIYEFSRFLFGAARAHVYYAFRIRSDSSRRSVHDRTPAHSIRIYHSATPITTPAIAHQERGPMSGRPARADQCLRRCPLAQQRQCAEYAITHREEYGVSAGVSCPWASTASANNSPGPMTSSAGSHCATSRELPEDAAIDAPRRGHWPATASVLHCPQQVGPRSAA